MDSTSRRLARRLGGFSAPALVGLAPFASAGVAFLVNVLMSRALGPGVRGEVATVLQLAYFAAPFLLLGADRRILRQDWRINQVTPTFLLLSGLAVAGLLSPWLDRTQWLALPVALFGAWMGIQRSLALRFGHVAQYLVTVLAAQILLAMSALVLFVIGAANPWLWLLPYVLPAIPVSVLLAVKQSSALVRGRGTGWRVAVSPGLMAAPIAAMVILRSERLMLPALWGPAEMGLYIAVATATEPVQWLALAFADHRVKSDRGNYRRLLISLLQALAFFAALATLAAILVHEVVIPLMGPEFRRAGALVAPLSLASVVLAMYRYLQASLLSATRGGYSSTSEIVVALAAVPIYFWFTSGYGAVGAAWGTVVVYAVAFGVSLVFLLAQRHRTAREAEVRRQHELAAPGAG